MNDVLKRITPAPLSRDRAVQDIVKAIDRELNAVDRATGDVLLLHDLTNCLYQCLMSSHGSIT